VTGLCYVDTSAFVKLLTAEAESPVLRAFLRDRPDQVSSVILDVEAHRVATRLGVVPSNRAPNLLEGLALVPLSNPVRALARGVGPPVLRSLDAIHLATAMSLRADLDVFVAYDRRLLAAAADLGLPVASPT